MTYASILLHDPAGLADPALGPAAWALGLAAANGARLTTTAFAGDGIAPADALLAAAAGREVDALALTERSFAYGLPEVLADHARLHDLVVTGSEPGGLLRTRALAEHLVFESGRPVVVVPQAWRGPYRCERVVVAWDNTRPAARALGDALPLLRTARAVTFVTVGGEKAIDSSLGEADVAAALGRRGVSGPAVRRIDHAAASIDEALAAVHARRMPTFSSPARSAIPACASSSSAASRGACSTRRRCQSCCRTEGAVGTSAPAAEPHRRGARSSPCRRS